MKPLVRAVATLAIVTAAVSTGGAVDAGAAPAPPAAVSDEIDWGILDTNGLAAAAVAAFFVGESLSATVDPTRTYARVVMTQPVPCALARDLPRHRVVRHGRDSGG